MYVCMHVCGYLMLQINTCIQYDVTLCSDSYSVTLAADCLDDPTKMVAVKRIFKYQMRLLYKFISIQKMVCIERSVLIYIYILSILISTHSLFDTYICMNVCISWNT